MMNIVRGKRRGGKCKVEKKRCDVGCRGKGPCQFTLAIVDNYVSS